MSKKKFTLKKESHVVATSDPGEATQLRAAGYRDVSEGKPEAKPADQATKPVTKK